MPRVLFQDWKPGLKKISLEMTIREHTSLSIGDAYHLVVNRLMKGQEFEVFVADLETAAQLAEEAERLGAVVRVVGD